MPNLNLGTQPASRKEAFFSKLCHYCFLRKRYIQFKYADCFSLRVLDHKSNKAVISKPFWANFGRIISKLEVWRVHSIQGLTNKGKLKVLKRILRTKLKNLSFKFWGLKEDLDTNFRPKIKNWKFCSADYFEIFLRHLFCNLGSRNKIANAEWWNSKS
jgi:hypothetical protein